MSKSNSRTVLIRPELLADGLGGSAKAGQAVFVRDGTIAATGPLAEVEQQTPPDTPIVDLDGCCLTPVSLMATPTSACRETAAATT